MTPDEFTIEEKMLPVGGGHKLYVQLWGSARATETILFLHGGPGSGCSDKHKSLFDPRRHRVIFFDQRGCGKSLPYGSLRHNTTETLVEDINKITAEFDVEHFTITGGSWGSCLALVYAIHHPDRVKRMVLRGIYTGRQKENDFLDKGGFREFFPEVWERFVESVPKQYHDDPSAYHQSHLFGDDADAAKRSAFAYAQLEGSVIGLDDRSSSDDYETFDPVPSLIELHYMANHCFLEEGYIFKNAAKLTMPIRLIQGRYDMVCPPYTAHELAQVLPDARLYWTTAGHSGNDRANWDLTRALLAQ